MVEKGMACIKYLLFAFNLLFFIFGLALLGVGIYVQLELSKYFDFFGNAKINATAILIIIVGAVTLIVGFFGCCGAVKENHCMTMTFAALISILLICEIGGGIAGYVLRGSLNNVIRDGMQSSIDQYSSSKGVTALWDTTQEDLKCCGAVNSSDWKKVEEFKSGLTFPSSCCKDRPDTCSKPYEHGCLDQIKSKIESNIVYVAGVAIGLGVVELIGIVLACCLGRAIRNEDSYA